MITIKANKKSFLTALKSVSAFAAVKGVMPILEHVRIHKPPGKELLLYCTDLERFAFTPVSIETSDEAHVIDLCANAKDLLAIVLNMSDEELILEIDEDKRLIIRGAKNKAKLKMPTMPSFDYPEITTGAEQGSFDLEASKLFSLIKKTAPFVSADVTKSVLSSVNIRSKEGVVTFQASDGYTLSVQNEKMDCGFNFDILLAGHSAEHCVRLFGSSEEIVSVTVYESYVKFQKGSQTIHCRLSNGKYADVSNFIPRNYAQTAAIPSSDLKEALQLISAANNKEEFNRVCLEYADPQSLILSAKGTCSANVPVSGELTGGDFTERKYNLPYFQRGVSAVVGDIVFLHFDEPRKQLVISGGAPEESLFTVCPVVDKE